MTNKRLVIDMDEKREVRNLQSSVTVTDGTEKRTVEGYALLFDTPSTGLSFEERIEAGALDGVIEKSDVYALLNHNPERGILARCEYGKGSLELIVDTKGLMYRFEAPKTALGDELLENIRRGEVHQSSFAFDVENDEWKKKSDGTWTRTIKKFGNIYDVSPVYAPAYSATSVYLRGRDEAERKLEEERRGQEPSEEYYENLRNMFNC